MSAITRLHSLFLILMIVSCQSNVEENQNSERSAQAEVVQVFSLDGTPFYEPDRSPELEAKLLENLQEAKENLVREETEENYIWYGRRLAYLNRYNEAIGVFSKGLQYFPGSYKLFRHRGHRYISTRKFKEAIEDLRMASMLIGDTPPEVEPDGAPNKLNIPLSNTQFNIYYHLGLAYYLSGNWEKAAEAYKKCMVYSINDDLKVATLDWMYMTYRRLGEEEKAEELLDKVSEDMEIIENDSYYSRLMMYKGLREPTDLLSEQADDLSIATQRYGVANYLIMEGRQEEGLKVLKQVVSGKSWSAFGFIAAEADLFRMNSGQ